MDAIGLECVVTSPEHKGAKYSGMSEFLIEKLRREQGAE